MFTTTYKNHAMDTLFGIASRKIVFPSSFTIGLSATAPNADGTNITEPVSNTGYRRVQVTFGAAKDGVVTNASAVSFPTFTEAAGRVTHYVLYSGDTPVWFGELDNERMIDADTVMVFQAGKLQIQLKDA